MIIFTILIALAAPTVLVGAGWFCARWFYVSRKGRLPKSPLGFRVTRNTAPETQIGHSAQAGGIAPLLPHKGGVGGGTGCGIGVAEGSMAKRTAAWTEDAAWRGEEVSAKFCAECGGCFQRAALQPVMTFEFNRESRERWFCLACAPDADYQVVTPKQTFFFKRDDNEDRLVDAYGRPLYLIDEDEPCARILCSKCGSAKAPTCLACTPITICPTEDCGKCRNDDLNITWGVCAECAEALNVK